MVSSSGRGAILSGYDPSTTTSNRKEIGTGYIKANTSLGIRLLVVHEAVFNPESPTTLLSEYQVREYGKIIDSVAKKHLKATDTYGTQRFDVDPDCHIGFIDRGGIMGFEVLPYEEGDDERYSRIEITSPKRWRPRRFRTEEENLDSTTVAQHTATSNTSTDMLTEEYSLDPTTGMPNCVVNGGDLTTTMTPVHTVEINPDYVIAQWTEYSLSAEAFLDSYLRELEEEFGISGDFTTNDDVDTWEHLKFDSTGDTHIFAYVVKSWHKSVYEGMDPHRLRPYLGWRPAEVVRQTLEHTTQLARSIIRYPLRKHFKARVPAAHVFRLDEVVSTDPVWANCKSLHHNFTGMQIFYGLSTHCMDIYGIKYSDKEFLKIYKDFLRTQGAPSALRRDNAPAQVSEEVYDVNREMVIQDQYSEPHNQHQNPVEGGGNQMAERRSSRSVRLHRRTRPSVVLCSQIPSRRPQHLLRQVDK